MTPEVIDTRDEFVDNMTNLTSHRRTTTGPSYFFDGDRHSNTSSLRFGYIPFGTSETSAAFAPVIAVYGIVMLVGMIGNPLLIYFFGLYQPRRATYMFISAVAVYDLIISCTSIPFEITDIIYYFQFPGLYLCRIFRYVDYFAAVSSGCIILAVAIERYRKICKTRITSVRGARVSILTISIFSMFSCFPAALIHSVVELDITKTDNITVNICTTYYSSQYQVYIVAFHLLILIVFSMLVFVLVVMYCCIYKHLKSQTWRRNGSRYTCIMICVTAAYILAYFPCIGLIIWRISRKRFVEVYLSKSQLLVYTLFVRSYLFNAAINPVIYGVLNAGFRNFILGIPSKIYNKLAPTRPLLDIDASAADDDDDSEDNVDYD